MSIKVDVGLPPHNLLRSAAWKTCEVWFHQFANITDVISSPSFLCVGHHWRLRLYPGEDRVEGTPLRGFTCLNIINMSEASTKIKFGFSVRNAAGREVLHEAPIIHHFGGVGSRKRGYGIANFSTRSKLMDALVKGSLVFEIRMKPMEGLFPQFIPVNPISKNILKRFNDEESADMVFEVGGKKDRGENDDGGEGSHKKSKTSTTFYAHHLVLKDGAPTLADMYKTLAGSGDVVAMEINDVTPDIFRHMLYYTYGGKLSADDLKVNTKDIIDACDKYGIVQLKLEAEACYVESTTIDIDNMMDNLLYADSKNCALLKEAVIDFVVGNGNDILGKISFNNVPGSVVTDILTAITREKNNSAEGEIHAHNQLSIMRVSELRAKLHENGLDVDGSREAMIAALQQKSSEETEVHQESSEETQVEQDHEDQVIINLVEETASVRVRGPV